jgi:hypothetical protein
MSRMVALLTAATLRPDVVVLHHTGLGIVVPIQQVRS